MVTSRSSDDVRDLILYRGGKETRALICLNDERWTFHQQGQPQPWEQTEAYTAKRVTDRLTSSMVSDYLREITGITFPLDWPNIEFDAICGMERSTKFIRRQIVDVPTIDDVS